MAGVNSACDSSGVTAMAAFPAATRSARRGCCRSAAQAARALSPLRTLPSGSISHHRHGHCSGSAARCRSRWCTTPSLGSAPARQSLAGSGGHRPMRVKRRPGQEDASGLVVAERASDPVVGISQVVLRDLRRSVIWR